MKTLSSPTSAEGIAKFSPGDPGKWARRGWCSTTTPQRRERCARPPPPSAVTDVRARLSSRAIQPHLSHQPPTSRSTAYKPLRPSRAPDAEQDIKMCFVFKVILS